MARAFRKGQPVHGRRIKCFTVSDDFSHACMDFAVGCGNSGQYVKRLLDQATNLKGCSLTVRTDNGPEFITNSLLD
jgi:putative transposase